MSGLAADVHCGTLGDRVSMSDNPGGRLGPGATDYLLHRGTMTRITQPRVQKTARP